MNVQVDDPNKPLRIINNNEKDSTKTCYKKKEKRFKTQRQRKL